MELPNTDIFDPLACVRRWEQYATQQEINVYLTKQIDLNRSVLKETIETQKEINASSSTTLKDHESRIASLESGLKDLNTAQTNLNVAFQNLQTDNNNFKSNVDLLLNQYQTTINLLQSNIDNISVSNEQLWNEVNKLKSQFDPDKLDAAIAGYDSVLSDAKKYADDINSELSAKINALTQTVTDNKTSTDAAIKAETEARQTEIANFEQEVRSALNQQDANINAFMASVNKNNAAQRQWLETELERVNKRIDNLDNKVESYQEANANTHTDLKDQIAAVKKEAADNLQEKYDELNRYIKSVEETEQTNTASLQDDINNVRKEYKVDIKAAQDALQAEIDEIKNSDLKQWDTINSILEAQNRINVKMEELNAYILEQIGLVEDSIGSVSERVEKLETENPKLTSSIKALDARFSPAIKVVAKAGEAASEEHDVGYGTLKLNITATQVGWNLSYTTGQLQTATRGGTYSNVNSGANVNAIANANTPNYVEGVFYSNDQTLPHEFRVVYNPFTKEVEFNFSYSESDMPAVTI
ncbi:coiled-coil domain-containing protein 186-like [Achroia grisella]|uniref:coiled-coil domain-containing protein 186-like n=1 Tax=Achroia grisella TaxID=688607 RepID=UPI0027D20BDC|nr:coiled-coil domain-containing protein 186-like [Achroia grisella]